MGKVIDETGHVHAQWTVLERTEIGRKGHARWACRCTCGTICSVTGHTLRNGNSTRCDLCSRWGPLGHAIRNELIFASKAAARKANHLWEVTLEEYEKLVKAPCTYCGAPPRPHIKKGRNSTPYVANGLDRIDNTKGYTRENTTTACTTCNYAKRTMSVDQFKSWATRLYKHSCRPTVSHTKFPKEVVT